LSGLVCLELWRFVSKWIYPQALALSVCRQRGSNSLKNPFHHASHPAGAFGSARSAHAVKSRTRRRKAATPGAPMFYFIPASSGDHSKKIVCSR